MNTLTLPVAGAGGSLTRYQWQILAICFVVALVDGFDTLMLAFIAPLIGKDFHLSPPEVGRLFAAGYLGAVIGGLAIGPLADRFGRKRMLLMSLCIISVFTFWCSRATTVQELMTLRLFAGLGLGGAMPTLIALSAESVPASHRSRAVTWMFMGYPLGAVVGGSVTAAFLSHGWHVIFIGGAVASLAMIPIVWLLLPESLSSSRDARTDAAPAGWSGVYASLVAQFAGGRGPAAVAMWLGVFSMMVASYFLVSWMPSVLVRSGFAPQQAAVAGVVLNVGSVVGAFAVTLAVKRFGAWVPVVSAFVLGTAMVLLLGERIGQPEGLWVLVFLAGMCIFGGQLSAPALSAQLFPRHVRGAGTGWVLGVGRTGSIVGPALGGVLMGGSPELPTLFRLLAIPVALAALGLALSAWLRPAVDEEEGA